MPLPKHLSYSFLIRNWRKSSLKHSSSPKACFLLESYSNVMKILSETSLLFHSMFLIQLFFEIISIAPPWLLDAGRCVWANSNIGFAYFSHTMNSSGRRSCPKTTTISIFRYLNKFVRPFQCFLFDSYSKLTKIFSEASLFSQSMFLIRLLFKIE